MTETPDHLRPFVLSPSAREPDRVDTLDIYLPDGEGPFPIVVVVHGSPLPPGLSSLPRDWPLYRGYGALLAAHGLLTVVPEYQLPITPGPDGLALDQAAAAEQVAAAVAAARADPQAEKDRVVLWFFSGGAVLSAGWLQDPPPWLRGVALTYPVLDPLPGMLADPRHPVATAVVGRSGAVPPLLLTRPGLEHPGFAAGAEAFRAAAVRAGAEVEVIDVPQGRHGFDAVDHTDASRDAVRRAVDWVRKRQAV